MGKQVAPDCGGRKSTRLGKEAALDGNLFQECHAALDIQINGHLELDTFENVTNWCEHSHVAAHATELRVMGLNRTPRAAVEAGAHHFLLNHFLRIPPTPISMLVSCFASPTTLLCLASSFHCLSIFPASMNIPLATQLYKSEI